MGRILVRIRALLLSMSGRILVRIRTILLFMLGGHPMHVAAAGLPGMWAMVFGRTLVVAVIGGLAIRVGIAGVVVVVVIVTYLNRIDTWASRAGIGIAVVHKLDSMVGPDIASIALGVADLEQAQLVADRGETVPQRRQHLFAQRSPRGPAWDLGEVDAQPVADESAEVLVVVERVGMCAMARQVGEKYHAVGWRLRDGLARLVGQLGREAVPNLDNVASAITLYRLQTRHGGQGGLWMGDGGWVLERPRAPG